MSEFTDRVLKNIELKEQEMLLELEEITNEFPDIFNESIWDAFKDTESEKETEAYKKGKMVGAAGGVVVTASLMAAYKLYKNWKKKKEEAETPEQKAMAQKKMDQTKEKIKKIKAKGK